MPSRDAGDLDAAFSQTQSALIKEIATEYNIVVPEDILANTNLSWDVIDTEPVEKEGFWYSRSAKNTKIVIVMVIIIWAIINSLKRGSSRRGSGGSSNGGNRSSFSGRSGRSNSSRGKGGGGSSGGGGVSR